MADIWSKWLLERRFGGDQQVMQKAMEFLSGVRGRVLEHANLKDEELLLDVGCGDGLIAFGALETQPGVRVIFSDISRDLLNTAQEIAGEMKVLDRCRFVESSADQLSSVGADECDAVTTRSVLIYVKNKSAAFKEFYRVLKPGGRLSIFEPINRFRYPEPDHIFWGHDVTAVVALARRVKALYATLQPMASDPMLDFDERDLVALAEGAGFGEVYMDYHVEIKPRDAGFDWERMKKSAGNPKIPTLEEAMKEVFSPEEQGVFEAHMRAVIEAGRPITASAYVYLWAVK